MWCWGIPSSAWWSPWFSQNTTGYAHTIIIISPPKTPKMVHQLPLYFLNTTKDHAFCPSNGPMESWHLLLKVRSICAQLELPLAMEPGKGITMEGRSLAGLSGWRMLLFCYYHRLWPFNTSSTHCSWPPLFEGPLSSEIRGIALYRMYPPLGSTSLSCVQN